MPRNGCERFRQDRFTAEMHVATQNANALAAIHIACGQACGQMRAKPAQSQSQQGPQGLWRKNDQRKCLTCGPVSACTPCALSLCANDQIRLRVKLDYASRYGFAPHASRLSTPPVDKPADRSATDIAQARCNKGRSKFGDKLSTTPPRRAHKIAFAQMALDRRVAAFRADPMRHGFESARVRRSTAVAIEGRSALCAAKPYATPGRRGLTRRPATSASTEPRRDAAWPAPRPLPRP